MFACTTLCLSGSCFDSGYFCSCGPKSKPADKDDNKEGDDTDEQPKLEEAVWEAKLNFLQVTRAYFLGKHHNQDFAFGSSGHCCWKHNSLAYILLIQI